DDVPICFESCCDFSYSPSGRANDPPPAYFSPPSQFDAKTDFITTIGTTIDTIDAALRSLSLNLHDHPELMFEEKYAHDTLTEFMESHDFLVTRQYLGLKTAWKAEFTHGQGGRTLGINSEMDALPLLGHACGHNLIAVSGVGVAIAVKSALKAHNIPGKVVLLGTPAEEGGGGKIILLERGGYDGMHACLMCHPTVGAVHSSSLGSSLAMQPIDAEFFGHAAHAGNAPWEGTNALDAAFVAYTSISVLRQQIKPDHRVHGIVQGCKGVIPDYAKMRWLVRAPDWDQLQTLRDRVKACFEGAATATGCRLKITIGKPYYDLRQNSVLAEYFSQQTSHCLGMDIYQDPSGASTDFVTYTHDTPEIPSLHPCFAIPTEPNGGNHTPAFAVSARSTEAHKASMSVTKGLAWTGFRVIADNQFYERVSDELLRRVYAWRQWCFSLARSEMIFKKPAVC
ncbi:hypothetical protein PAXINDRAFT_66801, partial [Paxillus involutus ATCC 200175]